MMESKVSFFLGANTPAGFYSLYDQLLEPDAARRVYLLKGGPGCGKSSLMRRAAQALESGGEPVEYIECSGDPNSLDAVIFPRLRAAIVDATAPHGGVKKSTPAARVWTRGGAVRLRVGPQIPCPPKRHTGTGCIRPGRRCAAAGRRPTEGPAR